MKKHLEDQNDFEDGGSDGKSMEANEKTSLGLGSGAGVKSWPHRSQYGIFN